MSDNETTTEQPSAIPGIPARAAADIIALQERVKTAHVDAEAMTDDQLNAHLESPDALDEIQLAAVQTVANNRSASEVGE